MKILMWFLWLAQILIGIVFPSLIIGAIFSRPITFFSIILGLGNVGIIYWFGLDLIKLPPWKL